MEQVVPALARLKISLTKFITKLGLSLMLLLKKLLLEHYQMKSNVEKVVSLMFIRMIRIILSARLNPVLILNITIKRIMLFIPEKRDKMAIRALCLLEDNMLLYLTMVT